MNYIKRCVGLPQETLAIFNGDLYVTRSLDYPENKFPRTAFRDRERADGWIGRALRGDPHDPVMFAPARPLDLWQPQNMFSNADQALKLFEQSRTRAALGAAEPGDFEIVRKSPARMMSMRRLVNDNDHQAADLVAMGMPPRWYAETDRTWTADNSREPRVFARVADETPMAWLRYRHLQPERPGVDGQLAQRDFQPHVITNTMGYNSNKPGHEQADDWVGDLMLEATALVSSSSGQLALELSKGHERFQARFDLATGECRLLRIDEKGEEKELAKAATSMTRRGSYALRLANFDERLTLWVNGQLPFGDGFAYAPAERPLDVADRPTDNDLLRPAGIGVEGADVRISHLKLWRDTCYTRPSQARPAVHGDSRVWTYFVQPGHFLCLGDNSAESSDSRFWGLVPERLMLGRAVTIYWPPTRMRVIQ
jgi:signal peptidase I